MKATLNPGLVASLVAQRHFGHLLESGGPSGPAQSLRWGDTLKRCLRGLDAYFERGEASGFYQSVVYGHASRLTEDRSEALAFEVLVQLALRWGKSRVTPSLLRGIRLAAGRLQIETLELVSLARAVTTACRDRYWSQRRTPSHPPERLAPPLRSWRAAGIAPHYLHWVFLAQGTGTDVENQRALEAAVAREPCESAEAKRDLFLSLCEGVWDARPSQWRRPRRVRPGGREQATALAVAIDQFRRSGLTVEDVVRERAIDLQDAIGVSLPDAFGFLYSLAIHAARR